MDGKKYLIGIHTTSGNSAPNFDMLDYRKLIAELSKNSNYGIVITDNKVHEQLSNIAEIKYPNIDSSLRRSILNFAALDCFISASTGPMHIVSALKVKTVSVFCPLIACSPKLWGPLGNERKIILPGEDYCSKKCPGDPKICSYKGESDLMINRIINSVESLTTSR